MKTKMNLLVNLLLVFALLASMSCAPKNDSSKEVAEDQNEDKFETKNGEQDAQFLVEAVDDSYTILNLARLANDRGSEATTQRALEIIDGQAKVLNRLKEYAAGEVISIPQSGPEKIRDSQKDLYDEQSRFDEKWCREVINENQAMIKDFEAYSEKADGNLKVVIDESLKTLRSHQDKLQSYMAVVNH